MSRPATLPRRRRDRLRRTEPRIRDFELGERLGYPRPRDVRKLISNLWKEGHLPGTEKRAAAARSRTGPKTPDFWLDERGALLVASQSGMAAGIEVTKEVIELFVRYRRGELAPEPKHPLFARQKREWEALWLPHVVSALCKLYGHSHLYVVGGRMPGKWFANVERRIYEHVWDSEHVAEAIRRMPDPRQGENWHQLLTDEARKAFAAELTIIAEMAVAMLSHHDPKARFWEWMEGRYLSKPLQLEVPGSMTEQPRD